MRCRFIFYMVLSLLLIYEYIIYKRTVVASIMMILFVVRNVFITGINKEANGTVVVVMMGQNGMSQ